MRWNIASSGPDPCWSKPISSWSWTFSHAYKKNLNPASESGGNGPDAIVKICNSWQINEIMHEDKLITIEQSVEQRSSKFRAHLTFVLRIAASTSATDSGLFFKMHIILSKTTGWEPHILWKSWGCNCKSSRKWANSVDSADLDAFPVEEKSSKLLGDLELSEPFTLYAKSTGDEAEAKLLSATV